MARKKQQHMALQNPLGPLRQLRLFSVSMEINMALLDAAMIYMDREMKGKQIMGKVWDNPTCLRRDIQQVLQEVSQSFY